MADEELTDELEDGAPKKKSKLPLIIGVVLALVGGGGGFFAVQSGMILGSDVEMTDTEMPEEDPMEALPDVVFVPIDPLVVTLGPNSRYQYLRFGAQLEVGAEYQADVEGVLPRVSDVLNGYLRAVDIKDLEKPSSLVLLRAQMLRRIQTVVGRDRVNDLLVMEFVLN